MTGFHPSGFCISGRYEIAGPPMRGGMGLVYLCNDLEEDRPVALKSFRPEFLPDRATRDRFLREGTHWIRLGAHPHIVRCYEALYMDPEVYLVLELVSKEQRRADASLRSWLTPGTPLPVETALLFALQIAWGMRHAVDSIPGLIHRDLKPENLLVGADRLLTDVAANRLRITDFGLVAVLQKPGMEPSLAEARERCLGSPGHTQLVQGVVGTPLYMAPEQWRGEFGSTATDVYALGCILYEMVVGGRAVSGNTLVALRKAHCDGMRQPTPAGLAEEVDEVIARCLMTDPTARYASWKAVQAALEAAYEAVVGQPAPRPISGTPLGRAGRLAGGWSYNALGLSYLDIGKADLAMGYFERAGAVGVVEEDPSLVNAALGNQGTAHIRLGNVHKAVSCYEQSLTLARTIGDRLAEGQALGSLGIAYKDLGEIRQAISHHEQSLITFREVGDRCGEAAALGNLGTVYAVVGNAHQAIGYHEQQLIITREIGDRRMEGNALGSLGTAYDILGDSRRAIGYHEKTLAISQEIGDRRMEEQALGNLGTAYGALGNSSRAISYLQQALVIAEEIRDRRAEGLSLMNLGSAHVVGGDVQRAGGYLRQAIAVFDQIDDVMSAASVRFNLGVLLVLQGRQADALPYIQQATQVFAESGDAQMLRRAQQLLARIQTPPT